jgi:integrase
LRENIREVTAKTYLKRLKILGKLGDLDDPQRIKSLICTYPASEAYKELLSHAYDYYVKFHGLSWINPRFTRESKPFFLPLEKELDVLIGQTNFKTSVFLQLLKETGADSGETRKLRWFDINVENKTVALTPTKNHNARTVRISSNLLSRILMLERKNESVFACKRLDAFRRRYQEMRNNLSAKLNNPRLHEVAFRSFRHWKATTEYHKTKDILLVIHLLGHRRLENTLVYTHMVNFESDDYICKIAKNVKEASALIESGFEYVTEIEGVKLFKK